MMEEPERYRRFILSYLQEYRQQRFLRIIVSLMHGVRSLDMFMGFYIWLTSL